MLASTVKITKGNEAVPISKVESHISDRCSHYTEGLFVSSPKLIWYSMIIALLFWFRFNDSWRAKEIKGTFSTDGFQDGYGNRK